MYVPAGCENSTTDIIKADAESMFTYPAFLNSIEVDLEKIDCIFSSVSRIAESGERRAEP